MKFQIIVDVFWEWPGGLDREVDQGGEMKMMVERGDPEADRGAEIIKLLREDQGLLEINQWIKMRKE